MHIFLFALLLLFWSSLPGDAQPADTHRRIVVESIEIEGNTKTKPEVILRYVTIQPGDAITSEMLLVSRERLEQTGFFKEVDLYTRPGSEKGKLVVVVEIRERKWPYYRFEGGHGDLNGWYIVPVGFCFDNFSGRGHRLDWRSKTGSRISSESLHYQYPNAFGRAGAVDVYLFGKSQEFFHFIGGSDINEKVKSDGFRVQISDREGRYKHAFLSYRWESYKPDDNNVLASFFPGDLRNTSIAALALGLQDDTRDNTAYPLEGIWGSLSGELALRGIGGEKLFPKILLDVRTYRRMSERNVFAFRVKGGYTDENTPFYERFYLGGSYSLRGYPTGRLTPVGWGTKLLLLQSEMRFPLSTEQFPKHKHTGVVYYDVGGIWLPGETPGIRDFSHSLGFGYRRRLRILGVLRIDFSLPTNKVTEHAFRFQLSLGNTF